MSGGDGGASSCEADGPERSAPRLCFATQAPEEITEGPCRLGRGLGG
ncbi:hypothetical protein M878_18340 [Streptomyces roseochromogenus subsp. oscitans DS 12.976]|uniref:Uncharacterized protein n=1 Tax=Streptomyces roseochromogenus subsp. oscitans DS 12.976 TaxID=1352936 RepID=V6KF31_STRRC|nr:hypothetical protein M878_18340 [Streptomyces roseochromogenus subsp. oscitans DS 12.976]